MTRPVLLDLFCGAGGAAVGYHRAGWDVLGIDIVPQPHYPFPMIRADAMTWPLERVDAIHASPPCQAFTTMANRARLDHVDLLTPTIERFASLEIPWVVENVAGASALMPNAFRLAGAMFGLGVHRPRYFMSNMLILTPAMTAPPSSSIGVYGKCDGRRLWTNTDGTVYRAAATLEDARTAMGMGWADWHGTKEAIPPAYTEHIGAQLLAGVTA